MFLEEFFYLVDSIRHSLVDIAVDKLWINTACCGKAPRSAANDRVLYTAMTDNRHYVNSSAVANTPVIRDIELYALKYCVSWAHIAR